MDGALLVATLKRGATLGMLALLPMFAQAQKPDSTAISDLLKEAESHAVLAQQDAETLEAYLHSTVSSESHANRLNLIRDHANDLIKDFNQLSSMREEGSPWQQEAIDRVNPLLHEMADNLSATIAHFKENKARTKMLPFRDYVKANRELMDRTSQLISDYVQYGETRAKKIALEKTLELSLAARENE
jgi:hypothetical protein